jgi:dTDP-glucose 4,6-dehydratase
MILVTGGAGFIGSNFALDWLAQSSESVVNLDKLTYAGNLENLACLQGDMRDRSLVDRLLAAKDEAAVLLKDAEKFE